MKQDAQLYIDFEAMTVITVHEANKPYKELSLKRYSTSIHSTLRYLKSAGYINCNDFGNAKVTHAGWCAFGATVQSAIKFTVRDVIVPVIVAVITSIITTTILS